MNSDYLRSRCKTGLYALGAKFFGFWKHGRNRFRSNATASGAGAAWARLWASARRVRRENSVCPILVSSALPLKGLQLMGADTANHVLGTPSTGSPSPFQAGSMERLAGIPPGMFTTPELLGLREGA